MFQVHFLCKSNSGIIREGGLDNWTVIYTGNQSSINISSYTLAQKRWVLKFSTMLQHHVSSALLCKSRGRVHWAVNYTGTQSSINMPSYTLAQKLWVLLLNLDWLVH